MSLLRGGFFLVASMFGMFAHAQQKGFATFDIGLAGVYSEHGTLSRYNATVPQVGISVGYYQPVNPDMSIGVLVQPFSGSLFYRLAATTGYQLSAMARINFLGGSTRENRYRSGFYLGAGIHHNTTTEYNSNNKDWKIHTISQNGPAFMAGIQIPWKDDPAVSSEIRFTYGTDFRESSKRIFGAGFFVRGILN